MSRDRVSSQARPSWLLDELATAGRENLDAGHVSRYDSKENADAGRELSLLVELGLSSESVVVEFGSGTGQFALTCLRIVAVDVSPVMLAAARARIDEAQLANVEFVQAGFLAYEHRGRPADFVYSRLALHHLPDFWKASALVPIHDILRPGGLLRLVDVAYSFAPQEAADRIEAWCATAAPSGGDVWTRVELEEHVRDEHSTYTWLVEPMLERAGFAIEDAEYSDDGILAKYVARRA